jgi:hypothetical protein
VTLARKVAIVIGAVGDRWSNRAWPRFNERNKVAQLQLLQLSQVFPGNG